MIDTKFLEWLAGHWEGDGRLELRDLNLVVNFHDSDNRDIHRYIYNILGFGFLGDNYLEFTDSDCHRFLDLVLPKLVSYSRASQVVRYSKYSRVKEVNLVDSTLDWLVGFWDANGSSGEGRGLPTIGVSSMDNWLIQTLTSKFGGRLHSRLCSRNGDKIFTWRLWDSVSNHSKLEFLINYLIANSKNEKRVRKLQDKLINYKNNLKFKEMAKSLA